MAANTTPIFTKSPVVSWGFVTGVDGSADGTDADVTSIFTADATNGSFVQKLVLTPISTSGSTTTSAAIGRIYINNGSTAGTAANNVLVYEVSLPAQSVNVAATTPVSSVEIPLNIGLGAGYKILVGVTAMAANTAYRVSAFGGDY